MHHLAVGVAVCECVCVCGGCAACSGRHGARHLESFSENFKCGRRGMCAQIKERKVKEKYSRERGWRVRDRHAQIHGGRGRP